MSRTVGKSVHAYERDLIDVIVWIMVYGKESWQFLKIATLPSLLRSNGRRL